MSGSEIEERPSLEGGGRVRSRAWVTGLAVPAARAFIPGPRSNSERNARLGPGKRSNPNLEGSRTPTWKVVELEVEVRSTGRVGRIASNRGVQADPVVKANLESCRTPTWKVVELDVGGWSSEIVRGVVSNRGVKADPCVTVTEAVPNVSRQKR